MLPSEIQFRQQLATEAQSWIGTPWHRNACVKGAGVDCGRFLFGVLREIGIVPEQKMQVFSHDWFCNSNEDAYLQNCLEYADKLGEAILYPTLNAPLGSVLLLTEPSRGRCIHGAIVTQWPRACHAIYPAVEESDVARHPMWMHKPVILLDPWPCFSRKPS